MQRFVSNTCNGATRLCQQSWKGSVPSSFERLSVNRVTVTARSNTRHRLSWSQQSLARNWANFWILHDCPDVQICKILANFWQNPIYIKAEITYIFKRTYNSVEIKCQLDVTEVFIADLIACSTCFGHHYAHHQELESIIQWLLPVVFRAVFFK